MKRFLYFILCMVFISSCSSSRWVVTDENAINTGNEPTILGEKQVLLLQKESTVQDPVLSFATYRVTEMEYEKRVKVERTIQKYRPKWKFLVLGMTGAVFAAVTGNTNMVLPNITTGQRVAFNVTAGILAALSFSNMEPKGDPIFTGETELQRRSGYQVVIDTLQAESISNSSNIELTINYNGQTVFSESGISMSNGTFDINLASFAEYLGNDIDENSSIELILGFNGSESSYTIPITDFLAQFVTVSSPVAILRNAPSVNELNVVTEVGSGSLFELIDEGLVGWYQVRFGGSEVYLSVNAGDIVWRPVPESGSPDVFEFADVPFGEIDVENSVPVLKQNNPNDRALILTNGFSTPSETREYLDRDHELFRFYMRYAFQIDQDRLYQVEVDSSESWQIEMENMSEMGSTGTLISYLSGFATIDSTGNIHFKKQETGTGQTVLNSTFLDQIERIDPPSVIIFADLEFDIQGGSGTQNGGRFAQTTALQDFSNELLRRVPNSAIVFSNRPGQTSSLYIGREENRRHHIFNYFLADAFKKRNTTVSEIIRHLENNVDYTSRRLHDRPQEIQAFGNFTINLAE